MMMIIVHGIGSRTVKFSAVVMIMSRIVVIIVFMISKTGIMRARVTMKKITA